MWEMVKKCFLEEEIMRDVSYLGGYSNEMKWKKDKMFWIKGVICLGKLFRVGSLLRSWFCGILGWKRSLEK